MGKRFLPRPIARYDQSLLPVLNENFQLLSRLLAEVPTETIGSTAPDDPYVGQGWFDTTKLMMKWWDGTNWTPDKPWTAFTPVTSQGVALSKNLTYSGYDKQGRTVDFHCLAGFTSSGTSGQDLIVTLPFTATVASNRVIGSGHVFNGGNVTVLPYLTSTTQLRFMKTSNGAAYGSGGAPEQILNTHALTFAVRYEATT